MRKVNYLLNDINNESVPMQIWKRLPEEAKGDIYVNSNFFRTFEFVYGRKGDIFHVHHYRVSLYTVLVKLLVPQICIIRTVHSQSQNLSLMQRVLWFFMVGFYDRVLYNSFTTLSSYRFSGKAEVVYNGIEMEGYSFEEKRDIDICLIGRMVAVKKWDEVILALNELYELRKDLRIIFVGEGPLKNTLKSLDKSGIEFTGSLPHNTAMGLLSRSKVSVFGSDHEGFCNSLGEAINLGVLPVCRDIPVFREVASECAVFYSNLDELKVSLSSIDFDNILPIEIDTRFNMKSHIDNLGKVYQAL